MVTCTAVAAAAAAMAVGGTQARAAAAPIAVDCSRTLADQFGYTPDYTQHVPAFDSLSRPYIRSRTASQDRTSFVHTLADSIWVRRGLLDALRAAYPGFAGTLGAGGYMSDRIVFDTQDRAYTLLTIRLENGHFRNVILYSLDLCASWRACTLPFGDSRPRCDGHDLGNMTCETFVGHNGIDGPPFVAVWREVGDWPGDWASRNELYVLQPFFEGDRLVIPPPTLVTRRFVGMVLSAGGASFAVTSEQSTYFVYVEVTSLASRSAPTFVARFDHGTGTIGPRKLICRAFPANDVHDTPGICVDSQGYLHVVGGAHHHPFRYTHSLKAFDISAWSRPRKVLTAGYRDSTTDADGEGRQTYLSFVCDQNDTLHIVSRQRRCGVDRRYPGAAYDALVHQSRPSNGHWSPARVLVYRSDSPGYVNYYQKLALDRLGNLYLSLNLYRPTGPSATRPLRRFRHRMVLFSSDGVSWRFATTGDFANSPP
jgi:hypothetical protein